MRPQQGGLNNGFIMSQTSQQDELAHHIPTKKINLGHGSELKSDIKPPSSTNDAAYKDGGYLLSALNSEHKSNHHQVSDIRPSFMNKLSQALPF